MLNPLLFLLILLSAFFIGILITRNSSKFTKPYITISLVTILLICLILQLYFPHLLVIFERNATKIQEGQWWRVFTALFFQDGLPVGGLSNIIFLLMIGSVAEQIFTKKQWLILYFLSAILTEIIALSWQPLGAGNSIAIFGLAGGISIYAFLRNKKNSRIIYFLFATSIVAAIHLFLFLNIHGVAFLLGILIVMLYLKISYIYKNK